VVNCGAMVLRVLSEEYLHDKPCDIFEELEIVNADKMEDK
jgi:hypothetical protein